jgi:hypothetical protein
MTQCCIPTYLLLIVALFACNRPGKLYKSPACYDLNNPYVIKLPSELDEISGLAYYGKDNSLFVQSDEKGCLYKIFLNKPTDIRKWKFSHKKDYEDIVLHDSAFYILNSNGDLVSLRFLNDSIVSQEFKFPGNGKNEFESLYYDDKLDKLVLICKDCEDDKKTTSSTYTFDMHQSAYNSAFTINTKDIAALAGPDMAKFKPSGAAINPSTGELYILSSINKLLVVADRNGAVKKAYPLNPKIFVHPEGIAFTPTGNLFISNEAGTTQAANILFYQCKKGSD